MAKDPAVLFYTSDFLAGTMTMSNEHVGMYIRLLCLQHQKGKLTEHDMKYICSTYVEHVYSKFKQDENGFYFNERLLEESEKRKRYSDSRKNNILKRYNKKDKSKKSTYVVHMENENENINEDINKDKNKKISKKKFYDCVLLTEEEHTKLTEQFNGSTDTKIKALNDYMMSTGKKYKSHYHTILNWERMNKNKKGDSLPDDWKPAY
jgi:hypothetical protein